MSEKVSIPLAIVIAAGLIAGAIYLSNANTAKQKIKLPSQNQSSQIRPVSANDHILGNPKADVIFVEYSDTECPYCKQFQSTMQRLINEFGTGGKVAWVYRHLPIDSIHKKSRNEAEAAECAGSIGGETKFWQYLDAVYNTTASNDSLDPAELPKIATAVGIDSKALSDCLSSHKFATKVQADYEEGLRAGAQGTPFTVIITKDGVQTPLSGAYPYDQLKKILDTLLK